MTDPATLSSPPESAVPPAYVVRSDRLLLRCWEPSDATLLAEAVTESFEHLLPWMPWVESEPEELQTKVDRLRAFRGRFDLGEDFIYAIFDRDGERVLGGTGLHPRRGRGTLEIGYWVRASEIGKGIATEATAMMTRVAFDVAGAHRVEIRCDPANVRSARVPEKLGFRQEGILRAALVEGERPPRDVMVWGLTQGDPLVEAIASQKVESFDILGRRFP